jgi:protein arginine N-methyltransferase 1
LQDYSTAIEPPIRCDVVISDLRGILPLYGRHIPSIVDVRRRWLADGGRLVPTKDRIYAAIIDNPSTYANHFSGWGTDINGWSLAPGRKLLSNSFRRVSLQPADLLTTHVEWVTLDYNTISDANQRGDIEWTVDREGTGYGFAAWFESELFDGVGLSNRPGDPELIYGQQFYPWPIAVPLQADDHVKVNLDARLVGSQYVWSWRTLITRRDGSTQAFDQSTFQGSALSSDVLSRARLNSAPSKLPKGRALEIAISGINGNASLSEIGASIVAELPEEFPTSKDAVTFLSSYFDEFWR